MRHLLAAVLILVAAESAALACSCVPPPRDAESRRTLARQVATGALALVEVELVASYERPGRGERLRVRRTLAGRAPAIFQVERDGPPSSASCDVEFQSGGRTLILLYPPRGPVNSRAPVYRIAASCTTYLLSDAAFRAALIREWSRRR
jgi:hypothetical protein